MPTPSPPLHGQSPAPARSNVSRIGAVWQQILADEVQCRIDDGFFIDAMDPVGILQIR